MEGDDLLKYEADSKAIVVGICTDGDAAAIEADLNEMSALLTTLGITTAAQVIQKRAKLSASHLLGKGKIDEIRVLAEHLGAKLVVIDHAISGVQNRTLEELTGCRVADRSAIILDIFSRTARTKQARTQVEIAKLEYLLPRMAGAWGHFGRQAGGGVNSRGMGEQQIEIDRRRARERVARLKKTLEHISTERATQRKSRFNELKVALVGYTNSGKTSLMKALTRSETAGKDALFATLDANTRMIDPNTRPRVLMSDTVGFINKLPHSLIESFRSTLEEVANADLLLHVVDASHPQRVNQIEVTTRVLEEIGAGHIPTLIIYNKADQVTDMLLLRILRKNRKNMVVSALSPDDMSKLRQHVFDFFDVQFKIANVVIPIDEDGVLSLVHRACVIVDADYQNEGEVRFHVRAPKSVIAQLQRYVVPSLET